MLLIAAAMKEELEAGMELCRNPKRIRSQGVNLWQAERGDRSFLFLKSGVGPRRSAESLDQALELVTPSRILVIGYAGALDADLKLGHLVAVRRALAFSLDRENPDWDHVQLDGVYDLMDCEDLARSALSIGLTAYSGDGLTSRYVLGDPVHKRLLRRKFGASVVDMETAALARIAESKKLPISCVRVISDEAEDTFLTPFSTDPSTGMRDRARSLMDEGMIQTFREWREHASVARESLSRFLSHYLGEISFVASNQMPE
jgi:nucleoside phosphorylase